MVRNLPSFELHSIHPALALVLLAITVSATMAILATLCAGSCHPKSPPEKQSSSSKRAPSSKQSSRTISKVKPDEEAAAAKAAAAAVVDVAEADPEQPGSPSASDEKVVLDPNVATHGPILPTVVPTDRSMRSPKRRLSMNLSVKLPEGLNMIKIKERHTKDAGEETIWKKTIILGEKCRIPSDDEDDSGSAGGENGSRRKNYHPKTPRSLPISPREVTFSNPEVSNPEVP